MVVPRTLPREAWTPEEIIRELAWSDWLSNDVPERAKEILPTLDLEKVRDAYLLPDGRDGKTQLYKFACYTFAKYLRHNDLEPFRADRKLRQLDLFD